MFIITPKGTQERAHFPELIFKWKGSHQIELELNLNQLYLNVMKNKYSWAIKIAGTAKGLSALPL